MSGILSNTPDDAGTANDEALSIDDAVTAFGDLEDDLLDDEDNERDGTNESAADDEAPEENELDPEEEDGENAEDEAQGHFAGDDVQVKMPDGTVTNVADLIKGNLMQADYTRKTQEIAQERKQADEARMYSLQMAQHLQQNADFVTQVWEELQAIQPSSEEWVSDPFGAQQKQTMFEQLNQAMEHVRQGVQQAQGYTAEQMQQLQQQQGRQQMEALTSKMPDLLDPAKFDEFGTTITGYLMEQGFTPEEIGYVVDHRQLMIAHKAAQFDALMAKQRKAKQKVKDVPPVGTSKRVRTSGESKRGRNAQANARLRKSGHVNDAAAALMDLDD